MSLHVVIPNLLNSQRNKLTQNHSAPEWKHWIWLLLSFLFVFSSVSPLGFTLFCSYANNVVYFVVPHIKMASSWPILSLSLYVFIPNTLVQFQAYLFVTHACRLSTTQDSGVTNLKGSQLDFCFCPLAIVFCYLELKLCYLKNLKLFSIRVKEL